MGIKKCLTVTGAAALLASGVATASPANASGTISGDVTCNDGTAVEGVWIAAAGGSGWASLSRGVFNKGGVTGPWTVHVGCGGSPSNWQYTVYGTKSINSNFANWGCYPPDELAYQTGCFTTAS